MKKPYVLDLTVYAVSMRPRCLRADAIDMQVAIIGEGILEPLASLVEQIDLGTLDELKKLVDTRVRREAW